MDAINPQPSAPQGIMPEDDYLHHVNVQRVNEIRAAFGRYLESGHRIPFDWMTELNRREDLKEKNMTDKAAAAVTAAAEDPAAAAFLAAHRQYIPGGGGVDLTKDKK